ncbi:hypothetical protein QTP86_002809, partial [Hemibagrus guttatus]
MVLKQMEMFCDGAMASSPARAASSLTFRNGFRCVPDMNVSVEDVLLAAGEQIGFENIISASRMNKVLVVFLQSEGLVNSLVTSGIWVKDTNVHITPLSAPVTKVTISNVPTCVEDGVIVKELSRFGKIMGEVKWISLGCKNSVLKNVMSFRRQALMILNSPSKTLDVCFRVVCEFSLFRVWRHRTQALSCPHKERGSKTQHGAANTETNTEQGQTEQHSDPVNELNMEVRPAVSADVSVHVDDSEKPSCSSAVSSVGQSDDADGSNVKTVGQSLSYSDIAKGAGHGKRHSGAARTGNQGSSDSDVAKTVSSMEKHSVALKKMSKGTSDSDVCER